MLKSILIVDDSIAIRRLVRTYLDSRPGVEVCGEAADGAEAITKARDLKPDLIVLDFSMPGMNGVEVAMALQPVMPTIPKILFTMHQGAALAQLRHSVGISAVMSKSDGMDALMQEIQRLLGMSDSVAAARAAGGV